MNAKEVDMRKDIDYVKSIDLILLIKREDSLDAHETLGINPYTTRYLLRDISIHEELEEETYEEILEVHDEKTNDNQEEIIFGVLPNKVEMVVNNYYKHC